MKFKKKYIPFILIAIILLLSQISCLRYLTHVSYNQLSILYNRRPIADVIKDKMIKPDIVKKLKLIPAIQKFAINNLGLKKSKSYLYYTQIDRPYVVYNVSASYPLELKSYTWYFPIVGSVPYKGYFEKQMAVDEYKLLMEEGLDARYRPVPAYSTLGWFDDPLLSSFLRQDIESLIELIFHEMAHSTLYFDSDTLVNESFASFVEEQGTLIYYKYKYGEHSSEVKHYIKQQKDYKLFYKVMKSTAIQLDKLYKSSKSKEQKLKEKKNIIDTLKFKGSHKQLGFKELNFSHYFSKDLNNAYFLSVLRYQSGEKKFMEILKKNKGSISSFINEIRSWQKWSIKKRHKILLGNN